MVRFMSILKKTTSVSEALEGKAFVRWLREQRGILFSHLAQNTPTTLEAAARLRAEGVRRGVPDYLIVSKTDPERHVFIELKRRKGGKVSKDQQQWLCALGNYAHVAYGWHEAKDIVERYVL